MSNIQRKDLELRQKLMENNEKYYYAIRNTMIGTSTFLIMSPIYLANMSEENIPIAVLSLLEIGAIYLPIKGIKDIIKTKKQMKLIKDEINAKPCDDLDDIFAAYTLIREDLDEKIVLESKPKEKQKLKNVRSEIDSLYRKK